MRLFPGRPGLIHHAELGSLPAPSSGIATRLTRAIELDMGKRILFV